MDLKLQSDNRSISCNVLQPGSEVAIFGGSAGVIRRNAGEAEAHLASPGFEITLEKDDVRILVFIIPYRPVPSELRDFPCIQTDVAVSIRSQTYNGCITAALNKFCCRSHSCPLNEVFFSNFSTFCAGSACQYINPIGL